MYSVASHNKARCLTVWLRDGRSGEYLAGLTSEESVSVNVEEPGLLFTSRLAEGVIGLTDLNVYESGIYQHHPPAFARKAAGDSSSPEIDITYRTFRHRLTIGDIAKL